MGDLETVVDSDLRSALEANTGRLGQTYALMRDGATTNRELIDGGAAANHGVASN